MRDSIPVVVSAMPFGLLFGALAIENGFTVLEAVLMSALVYAGASQMVGIELFGQNIAPWLIVFSIFAVNFRHVLYSAAMGRVIRPWTFGQKALGFYLLTDPQFAVAETKAAKHRPLSYRWYLGLGAPIYFAWLLETWVGASFGKMISNPEVIGLDFLLSIYFLGLVMSFRKRRLWLPVVLTSGFVSILAYQTVGSPWHVSIGAISGVFLAAMLPMKRGSRLT